MADEVDRYVLDEYVELRVERSQRERGVGTRHIYHRVTPHISSLAGQ